MAQDSGAIRRERDDGTGILCAGGDWQLRLGGDSDQELVAKAAQLTSKPGGFIDLGDLRSGGSRYEVRLELGAGMILSIARG
jgi:hypothetical protein